MENSFSSRRWTNQTSWRRSGLENIHLDTGSPNSRRKSTRFSWTIRRVSTSTTSRLTSGCQWSDKWLLVHVRKLQKPPSLWTQSQTWFAERRVISFSTETHWRLQNYSYKFGCQARETHRWLLEYRWVKGFVWSVNGIHPAPDIHEHMIHKGYGTLRISSRTTSTILSALWPIAWTSHCTLTWTQRSSEHAAHRL